MFRCQICNQVAAPGTRATKVVVISRERIYEPRGGGGEQRGRGRFRGPRKPTDQGGKGHEIVREMTACVACAAKQETTVIEAPPAPEPESEVVETPETETAVTETPTEDAPAKDAPAEEAKAEAAE